MRNHIAVLIGCDVGIGSSVCGQNIAYRTCKMQLFKLALELLCKACGNEIRLHIGVHFSGLHLGRAVIVLVLELDIRLKLRLVDSYLKRVVVRIEFVERVHVDCVVGVAYGRGSILTVAHLGKTNGVRARIVIAVAYYGYEIYVNDVAVYNLTVFKPDLGFLDNALSRLTAVILFYGFNFVKGVYAENLFIDSSGD